MAITNRDVEKLRSSLQEWRGGAVSLNAFHDDHDRLLLKLVHPSGEKKPIGLTLFYCSYLAGPIRWTNSALEPSLWLQQDELPALELTDKSAGFTVRCAGATLYGEPGLTIPSS